MIDFKLAKDMNINALFGEKGSCDCGTEHFLPATEIYSYEGASEKIKEVVERLCPVGKVLLVGVDDVLPYIDEVDGRLSQSATERLVISLGENVSESTMSKLDIPEDARLVIAIGSGTACDISKLIAKKLGVPLVLFLTAMSCDTVFESDVEIWRSFVLTKEYGAFPSAVIVDHDIIAENSDELFAAAIGLAATEYLTVFDCYTREKFLKAKVCPHMIDMLIVGVEKVLAAAEEIKNHARNGIEHFVDGMLKISAARALLSVDLTNSVGSTMRALYLLRKKRGAPVEALYGAKAFEVYVKLVNVFSLFYETKTVEETLPPDMDYRYELLTKELGVNEWAAYKITSQLVSPKAYEHIKKAVDENREYFADAARELKKSLPAVVAAYDLFAEERGYDDKKDLYIALVSSTELCGSFTTLSVMKYLGLLERYDG